VLLAAGAETSGLIPEEPPVSTRDRNCLTTAGAILAEAEGRIEEAVLRFAEAGAAWLAYGSVLELGHARFGEGRCRRVLGDPGAEEPLREAHQRFASLGAAALVAEIEGFLG
jgi:hypothetical protein